MLYPVIARTPRLEHPINTRPENARVRSAHLAQTNDDGFFLQIISLPRSNFNRENPQDFFDICCVYGDLREGKIVEDQIMRSRRGRWDQEVKTHLCFPHHLTGRTYPHLSVGVSIYIRARAVKGHQAIGIASAIAVPPYGNESTIKRKSRSSSNRKAPTADGKEFERGQGEGSTKVFLIDGKE